MWDVEAAVKHLDDHAPAAGRGRRARYVREAVEAGGVTLARTPSAKDYGPGPARAGFVAQAVPGAFRAPSGRATSR